MGPSGERLRVATYNIRFLDADKLVQEGDRREKLLQVIERLEADVIGLQETTPRCFNKASYREADFMTPVDTVDTLFPFSWPGMCSVQLCAK